jgi:hypothetical protein
VLSILPWPTEVTVAVLIRTRPRPCSRRGTKWCSFDVFVFVAQHRAPSEAELHAAASRLKGIEIDVNVPPMDLTTHATTFAYVAWTIGAERQPAGHWLKRSFDGFAS